MALTLADSDVLIDFLRDRPPAAAIVGDLIEAGQLATSTISQFELLAGARTTRQAASFRKLFEALVVVEFEQGAAEAAAQIRRDLEKRGEGIGTADYLIAGIAVASGLPLLTRNKRHFERVPDLVLAAE